MITQSNRRYKLLDLLRLFCACLVIFILMGLGDDVAFVPCMTRQAVPFFFLVSGYLFSSPICHFERSEKSVPFCVDNTDFSAMNRLEMTGY